MMVQRTPFIILMLICALVLCFIWSLSAGAIKIPASTIINTLFDLDGPQQKYIINRSRLPRSLIAILCGGALALSGSIIQGILRNPLASPKIIGINSGAAFAVLSSAIITPNISSAWLPLIAAVGGIMAASLIYFLAELRSISPSRLILIGIAVGFMIDAGVEFILVTAGTFEISTPLIWLTGSLWGRGWQHLDSVWPLILALAMIAFLTSFRLDLLHLGSEQATGLGVNVRLERLAQLSLATLLAAVSVSVVGVLGFVGLMAPHIARKLVGGIHQSSLPVSMLIGSLLVLSADAIGHIILPPVEVSAGILTAIFGAPFFIIIMLTQKSRAFE